MIASFIELLKIWNKSSDDRAKVQHIYLFGTVVLLFVAGIVSLVNYSLGQVLLFGTLALLLIFVANAVVWALVYTFVLSRLKPKK